MSDDKKKEPRKKRLIKVFTGEALRISHQKLVDLVSAKYNRWVKKNDYDQWEDPKISTDVSGDNFHYTITAFYLD